MLKLNYPKFWQDRNIIAYLLLPFGYIYLLLGVLRKFISRPVKFKVPTICIGNATVGGTGKTQMVIKLAREFDKRNINFIILCKGYGGKNRNYSLVTSTSSPYDVGDEALELCEYGRTFAVPQITDATEIIEKYKPDIILVDDGMQNPNFKKDFVIMTIDGSRGFGNGFPVPAGPMRCKIEDIKADAVVVVGNSKQGKVQHFDNLFKASIKPISKPSKQKRYAFAGIGNPDKFFDTLNNLGVEVIEKKVFPDHYNYTKTDVMNLISYAKSKGLRLITTRKDYVKIRHIFYFEDLSLQELAAEMIDGNNKNDTSPELHVDYLEIELDVERFDEIVDAVSTF